MASRLRQGLVAYWPLDEASGTRRDEIGGNTLTDNNTVTGSPGPSLSLPLASQFTGANSEYLSIADNDALSVEGQDFSFLVWLRLDSKAANVGIAAKDNNAPGGREWWMRYTQATDRFVFNLQNSTTAILGLTANNLGSPATGTWYMMLGTYQAATRLGSISVNAGARDTGTATGDITASNGPFVIGREFGAAFMDGRMAGAAFWKRAISEADERWLYNGGAGRAWPWR